MDRKNRHVSQAIGSLWIVASAALAAPAYGQESNSNPSQFTDYCNGAAGQFEPALHGWYWTWENDVAGMVKSDSGYTQGAQIGYTLKTKKDNPNLLAKAASSLCKRLRFDASGDHTVLGASSVFLGQQLFTPKDTRSLNPIADDRPYAGWAYLGARLELLQPLTLSAKGRRRWRTHSFELQAGVVGPSALGEQTQSAAHNLDGSAQSNGWQNQIANRVGVQAVYNFSTRLTAFDLGGLSSDVLWQINGALGNLQTYAGSGLMWRLGRNMGLMAQRTIQPSALTATMSGAGDSSALSASDRDTRKCDSRWLFRPQECYVFVGINVRGVYANSFLEAAASGAGRDISADRFVYELAWGFRVRYPWARFDYISTTSSREFAPAPANPLERKGRHDFGSLTMSCYGEFGGYSGKWELLCPGFVTAVVGFLIVR